MIKSYSPRARVTVLLTELQQEIDISKDLVNLTTTKGYGKAAGGWSITLPYKYTMVGATPYHYKDLFQPDDIVSIEMDAGDGLGFTLVMVGLVSRAARRKATGHDGTPQRSICLVGMDMGKLLLNHDCGWSIALQEKNLDNPEILRLGRGLFFTGTPAQMLQSMFNSLFLKDVTEKAQYFDFQATTTDDWILYNYAVLHSTGPVWNAMKACANEPWNILYTETTPEGKFLVGLEQMPIKDDGKLARTEFTVLEPQDIVSEDLGISDDDRVNFEYLKTCKTILGLDDTVPIQNVVDGMVNYDEADVASHGFRKKIIECSATFEGPVGPAAQTSTSPDFMAEIQNRSIAFWNRMQNNHLLESGSFKTHLLPRTKAGSAILTENFSMEYFVEQVSHDMNFGERPSFTTVLNVTRGQEH